MTTIIEADPTLSEVLASATGASDALTSIDEVRAHLEHHPSEYALVLGPSVNLGAAVALADTLRVTRATLSVILVRDTVDTAVLAEALRSGMREVTTTQDLSNLSQAVRRAQTLFEALSAQNAPEGQRHVGHVITVFSAKGGVGKTTVATNLSVALAERDKKVCLIDLDLAFGDVAITLQIFPTRTIADAVPMQAQLDMQGLESLLTPFRDNMYALVAPIQPDAKDTISAALVGRIIELLKETFDYIVLDTPPAFDDQVLQAFDSSDRILLIATPDIPALKNLKITLETLTLLNYPRERTHLVLNRALPKVGVTAEEVSTSLSMPIVAMIPSSADVPASVNRGEPIVIGDPKHSASRGILALADFLTEKDETDEPIATLEVVEVASPSRRGLFRGKVRS
ncbi:MAG: AAA family ATPase [Nocardioidaceae bacterium]